MTAQGDLFATARRKRDDGIRRAASHAGEGWQALALALVRVYAGREAQFLAEDARAFAEAQGLPEPPDGRAWGAVMQRARRERIIVAIGYAPARSSNLSPKVLWRRE